jgi:hypothetical protein
MAMAVVFIGWNQPHPGLEQQSRDYLEGPGVDSLRAFEGIAFERFERLAGSPSGALRGGAILYGERDQLESFCRTHTFASFTRAMAQHFDGFGVTAGVQRAPRARVARSEARAALDR